MQSSDSEYMDTPEAERYSKLKGLAKRRVLGPDAGPPYIKCGDGKNSKVIYARTAIDEWMQARMRRSTSEHTVATRTEVA